jgi:hypothetical protein
MHKEIATLANRLFNVLNELEQHVPPADLRGKRLIYEAHQRLKEIPDCAEQSARLTGE